MTRIIERLDEIAQDYDALFCDLWGCVHDGIRPFPAAVDALVRYRANGGRVIMITNAPRQKSSVVAQIDEMGLPREAWDDVVTSGDTARAAMFRGVVGQKVFFIGEPRDLVFFEPTELVSDPVEITRVGLHEATGIVCTGPFDPMAPVEDLRPQLLEAKTRGMKLLCANPDIVVDRGEVREWCAGAVAQMYTEMGGESLYFGKPHPPLYDLARDRLAAIDKGIGDERILAVGDGIGTDIRGAMGEGLDSLYITGGLAATETGTEAHPHADKLQGFLDSHQLAPTFAAGALR